MSTPLGNIQELFAKFLKDFSGGITTLGDAVKGDMNALIASIDAQVAGNKMTTDQGNQAKQFPNNVITLVNMIESQLGEIPAGAGPFWLIGMMARLTGQQQKDIMTQVKLVLGSGQAMLNMPGLNF